MFKAEKNALAGAVEVKCRRCRQFNILRPVSPSQSAR
ncbi:MAG: hypothetical protein KDE07_01230 [Sphingomonadaceae bacterium]|nr:hypothetical protein [Sphingomonadaceae bacterium]MCP5383506.1 hypothetical protein [Altererythrobacter sp.]